MKCGRFQHSLSPMRQHEPACGRDRYHKGGGLQRVGMPDWVWVPYRDHACVFCTDLNCHVGFYGKYDCSPRSPLILRMEVCVVQSLNTAARIREEETLRCDVFSGECFSFSTLHFQHCLSPNTCCHGESVPLLSSPPGSSPSTQLFIRHLLRQHQDTLPSSRTNYHVVAGSKNLPCQRRHCTAA